MVTDFAYSKVQVTKYDKLADKISDDGLTRLLLQKERDTQCNDTFLNVLRRLRNTLTELSRKELKPILSKRAEDSDAWVKRYAAAFVLSMVVYLGKRVVLEHHLSHSMPENVLFHGIQLNDIEFVALAAIFQSDEDVLTWLFENGKIRKRHDFYSVAHYLAAYTGNVSVCEMAVREGELQCNDVYQNNKDILSCAASRGHLNVVNFLLKEWPDIIDSETTALFAAAEGGHHDVLRVLLDAGAKLDRLESRQLSPLSAACRSATSAELNDRYIPIINTLLEHKAALHRNLRFYNPLQLASLNGNLEIVKLLLKAGAHPDSARRSNRRPVVLAARSPNVEVVKHLMECGATIRGPDQLPNEKVLDFFLENHNVDECLPYWLRAAVGIGNIEMARKLINRGACAFGKIDFCEEPIEYAPGGNSNEIVELLCENGARASRGALFAAASVGNDALVASLLRDGAATEGGAAGGSIKQPPLHTAMLQGHESTVKLLLDAGASCMDPRFPTIVVHAASKRHFNAVKLALKHRPTACRLPPAPEYTFSGVDVPLLPLLIGVGLQSNKFSQALELVKKYGSELAGFMEFLASEESNVIIPRGSPAPALIHATRSHDTDAVAFLFECFKTDITEHLNLLELTISPHLHDIPMLEFFLCRLKAAETKPADPEKIQVELDKVTQSAISYNWYPIVEMLISAGGYAKPYPLSEFVVPRYPPNISPINLDEGIDRRLINNIKTNRLIHPLFGFLLAMDKKNELMMRLLISAGALQCASEGEIDQIVHRALKYGCTFLPGLLGR